MIEPPISKKETRCIKPLYGLIKPKSTLTKNCFNFSWWSRTLGHRSFFSESFRAASNLGPSRLIWAIYRMFSDDFQGMYIWYIYIYVLLVSYDVIATPLKNHGVKVSWDMLGWWFPIIIGKVIKFHGSSHHQPVSVIENHWNKAPVELFWHISSASLGPPLGSCLMTI